MKHNFQKLIGLRFPSATIFLALLLVVIASCKKEISQNVESYSKVNNSLKDFTQVNLVGNNDEYSPARVDPNFVNGWGIAISPNGFFWVSTEGTGTSVIYNKDGGEV